MELVYELMPGCLRSPGIVLTANIPVTILLNYVTILKISRYSKKRENPKLGEKNLGIQGVPKPRQRMLHLQVCKRVKGVVTSDASVTQSNLETRRSQHRISSNTETTQKLVHLRLALFQEK